MPRIPKRAAIMLLSAAGVLGVTGVLLAFYSVYRLPAPEEADREQLMRWLVTRDLRRENESVCAALIVRLQTELDAGVDFAAIESQIDERGEAQLRANVDVLFRQWFLDLAKVYQQTDRAQRATLLDAQIDRLRAWRVADYLTAEAPRAAQLRDNPLQAFAELSRTLDGWADSARPEAREATHEFAAVVQARVAWRALAGWDDEQ